MRGLNALVAFVIALAMAPWVVIFWLVWTSLP
jgi:hypothetical protein